MIYRFVYIYTNLISEEGHTNINIAKNTKTHDETVEHYQAVVSQAGQSGMGTFVLFVCMYEAGGNGGPQILLNCLTT